MTRADRSCGVRVLLLLRCGPGRRFSAGCCGIPENHSALERARRFACPGDFDDEVQGTLKVEDQAPAGINRFSMAVGRQYWDAEGDHLAE